MRLAKTLSLFCAAILMTGCGSGNKEEKLVSDFLNKNLKENNISQVTFSEVDSTSHVSDSVIGIMRNDAERSGLFRSDLKYAERTKGQKLHFISVSYTASNGKRMRHTFYLDKKSDNVICIKNDDVVTMNTGNKK